MKQPDIGSHRALPPIGGEGARAIATKIAMGSDIGSQMWFDDDMVTALRGGATKAGWSGVPGPDGLIICLDVMGTHHRWTLTGRTRPHTATPGRVVHEGIWPD